MNFFRATPFSKEGVKSDRTMTDEQTSTALTKAEAEHALKRYGRIEAMRFPNATVMGLGVGGFLFSFLFLFTAIHWIPSGDRLVPFIRAIIVLGTLTTLICNHISVRFSRRQKQILDELLPRCGREHIDILCKFRAGATSQKLIELLPTVGQDGEFLSRKTRAQLSQYVNTIDPTLILAFLRALEQIGDVNDLPELLHLAQIRIMRDGILTNSAYNPNLPQIKAQAQHTLSLVEARIARETARETLLRPSDSSEVGSLLRPATEIPDPAPQTLLRASTQTEEDAQTSGE